MVTVASSRASWVLVARTLPTPPPVPTADSDSPFPADDADSVACLIRRESLASEATPEATGPARAG